MKNRYRVYWGNQGAMNDLIDAPTAEDALTIATLNFKRFGTKPEKIEFVGQIKDRD